MGDVVLCVCVYANRDADCSRRCDTLNCGSTYVNTMLVHVGVWVVGQSGTRDPTPIRTLFPSVN